VYEESIDDVIGILSTRDYLLESQKEHPRPLRSLLREAYFVPGTVLARDLFRQLQQRKQHMAIIVDEYGGMSGLVTMEDLLEEIVGNIYDEFDPQAEAEITRLEENLWRISGAAPLTDVADNLSVSIPEDENYDTLGGLIFSRLDRIPADGSTPEVDVNGLHIRVEKIAGHRVLSALVSREPDEVTNDAPDAESQHEHA